MFEAIIWFLIKVCVAGGLLYLIIYVLQTVFEVKIPPKIITLAWVVFMLLVLLWLWILLSPLVGGSHRKLFSML
jgi:hypothetical protein